MAKIELLYSAGEVSLYQLANEHIRLQLTNWGAAIYDIQYLSDDGTVSDLVLTCDTLESFVENRCYFGSTVGRSVNRIKNAQFALNGKTYHLEANDGNSNSHGGFVGFSFRPWNTEILPDGIAFHLHSHDGEGGFPGNMNITVTYTFSSNNDILIQFDADTDQDTPINVTNHTYWAIGGAKNIYCQKLRVDSSRYLEVNNELTPTGNLLAVDSTIFDFRAPVTLGDRLCPLPGELSRAGGFDVSFAKDSPDACALLCDSDSGRQIKVTSSMPILHIYTGNFLRNVPGKGGQLYQKHDAVCVEPSYYPDAIHHDNFGFAVLKAGERFSETITINIQ